MPVSWTFPTAAMGSSSEDEGHGQHPALLSRPVLSIQNIMQAMYVIFHSGAAIFKKMKRNRGI